MFSSAFLPQQHKAVNGFHLNHDNLIVLESKDRQKVITYFIAQQNPEKLDPADRGLIKASTASLDNLSSLAGLLAAAGLVYRGKSLST